MRSPYILPALSLGVLLPQVIAYGKAGHEIVADIAEAYLFPSALANISSILPAYAKGHLGPVAAWADQIKYRNRWSSAMHYVNGVGDHPGNYCVFGEEGWQGKPGVNLLSAIRNTTDWLRDEKDGAEEALKFLIHFLGDMHMPLHLTGRGKGGNSNLVHWNGRTSKLHQVWDGLLIAKEIRDTPSEYNGPIANDQVEDVLRGEIYDPYTRFIFWEGLLDEWADELEDWAACPFPDANPTSVGTIYAQAAQTLLSLLTSITRGSSSIPPTDDSIACPFYWAEPIHELNCEIVWPPEMDSDHHPKIELDTEEYAGRIRDEKVLQKLLAMAGVRLAAILNSLFGAEAEMGGKTLRRLREV